VVPQPHKRPKSSYVRFEADQPNERWQVDITHWALADGADVEILNLLDDHSRLAVGSDAQRVFQATDVVTSFRRATTRYGLPAQMLSDNAAVFTGIPRRGGRVALEIELASLGISFRHSRPYHPQTCGKVERFHQTLKRWLVRQSDAPVSSASGEAEITLPLNAARRCRSRTHLRRTSRPTWTTKSEGNGL
jgi:transposase InsO family protein